MKLAHASRLSTLVLSILFLSASTDAFAQNVLVNGDFEFGDTTSWEEINVVPGNSISIVTPDNGPSAPGSFSVLMDNQVDGLALLLKQSSLAGTAGPGDVDYSFDIKLIEENAGGVLFIEIFAEQADGGVLGGTGVLGPFFNTEWETVTGSFVAPAGTDFLTFQFAAITGANIGSSITGQVDNASLTQDVVSNDDSSWSKVKATFAN